MSSTSSGESSTKSTRSAFGVLGAIEYRSGRIHPASDCIDGHVWQNSQDRARFLDKGDTVRSTMRVSSLSEPRPLLLLADDDSQIRQLLSEVGEREKFDVLEAADGAAAIEMLQRRHIDLVLLDLHMPRVNGLDVLRAVRASGTSSQIALMSGDASVEDAVEAVKL